MADGIYLGDKAVVAAADLAAGDHVTVVTTAGVRLVEWSDWEGLTHDALVATSVVALGALTVVGAATVSGDLTVGGNVAAGSVSLSTGAFDTCNAAVAAAGTTQGTATALTTTVSQVTSASGGTADGVRLTYQSGQGQFVANESGATVKVYPPTGASIDDLSANAAYSLADNAHKQFRCVSATKWLSF